MFELHNPAQEQPEMAVPSIRRAQISQIGPHEILVDGLTPVEFTFRGRRFRIHSVLSRWCEAGGWWNRISDGMYRPDDGARALWRVEAAPVGALTTFEIERDEVTGTWRVTVL